MAVFLIDTADKITYVYKFLKAFEQLVQFLERNLVKKSQKIAQKFVFYVEIYAKIQLLHPK